MAPAPGHARGDLCQGAGGARAAPGALPITARSSTSTSSSPTRQSHWRFAGPLSMPPRSTPATWARSTRPPGASWSSCWRRTRSRSRTWSGPTGRSVTTRGHVAAAPGWLPRPAQARLDRSTSGAPCPTPSWPSSPIRTRMIVTANNRIVDEYPHHVSSEYLDGFRARRIEELLASAEEHDLDGFARIQIGIRSIPGRVVRRRLARLPPVSASCGRSSGCEAGTVRWSRSRSPPPSTRRSSCAWRGVHPSCDRRSRPGRALPRPRRQRVHDPSPWRWQAHLLDLWEEGDEALIGRPGTRLVLDALRSDAGRPRRPVRSDPEGWRWGGAPDGVPARPRWREPPAATAAQPLAPVGGARRTVAQIAYVRSLSCGVGPELWSRDRRSRSLALADVHRPVGASLQPPFRRPAAGLAAGRYWRARALAHADPSPG